MSFESALARAMSSRPSSLKSAAARNQGRDPTARCSCNRKRPITACAQCTHNTITSLASGFAVRRSSRPSASRSVATIDRGLSPTAKSRAAWSVPSPLFPPVRFPPGEAEGFESMRFLYTLPTMRKPVLPTSSKHATLLPALSSGEPEPAWAVATLFPAQGSWSERDYLELPTNRLVELSDGLVEVLTELTRLHQRIVAFLYEALKAFASTHKLGEVYFAPLPLHLWAGKYREPDVVFSRSDNTAALQGDYLEGADLVVEVVSPDDPERDSDWVKKREEYARAGIPEYWIVDPSRQSITVLRLETEAYVIEGEYPKGTEAHSVLLPGFKVPVGSALAGS